jgi:hypothetical protein
MAVVMEPNEYRVATGCGTATLRKPAKHFQEEKLNLQATIVVHEALHDVFMKLLKAVVKVLG